jgi:hypothetical protein
MLGALAAWMYRRRKKQEEEAGESFEDIADRMENSGPSNVLQMSVSARLFFSLLQSL